MVGAHAILSTHTTRHLRAALLGVAFQSHPVKSVVVSCDNDDPDIAKLVQDVATELDQSILLVQRPHQGVSRSSQVRNNAVRALVAHHADPADRLWFLDGDCCPAPDALANHDKLASTEGGTRNVVVAFRVDLTPEQTAAFDENALRSGQPPVRVTDDQLKSLKDRDTRYRRHTVLRRLGLVKPHKPKLLSANFSVDLRDYLAVNGFNEDYQGYGQEDDDLGRRLYASGVAPHIGVASALVYHLYHPTRAPQAWEESPNAKRFAQPFDVKCAHGVENPIAQPEPRVTKIDPGPAHD